MNEHWKQLIEDAHVAGVRSQYADRLRAQNPSQESFNSLQREILNEMADALARAGNKVDAALLALELIEHRIEKSTGAAREALVAEFNAKREEALSVRRDLMIHREAIGFRNNAGLNAVYPVPPRKV